MSVVLDLQTVDISEIKFYRNYLTTYSHTNSVFSAMFVPRAKWPENFRIGLLDINSYKKHKMQSLKIGQDFNIDLQSNFL